MTGWPTCRRRSPAARSAAESEARKLASPIRSVRSPLTVSLTAKSPSLLSGRETEVAMDDKLAGFVEVARQKGLDHTAIFLLLRSFGWKEKQIAEGLAVRDLGIAV